ncbi:MAG: hypothetical protein E6J00_06435 [Chloroflexi bacterium]|nr:MAG: hypothetical protein E6J00_06435 [Chloroflexota bacterium]
MMGLGLRLYGIGFGLPALYRPDEDVVVGRAMGILSGVLDPHFADWPHLYFFIAALWLAPLRAIGIVSSQASAYLAVRCLDALLGAAMVLLLFRFGRQAYGRTAALIAAAGLTVAFLPVRDSHFATLDVPVTFACLLVLLAADRLAAASATIPVCGALVGLAASIKYSGALAGAGVAAAQALRDRAQGVALSASARRIAGVAAIAVAFLILGSPFLLLHPATTLHGIGYVFYHLERQTAPEVGWLRMPIALWYGLDPPLFILAMGGLALALARRTRTDWVILAFVAATYVLIGSGHSVFFRYVDPLIPPLLLLGGRVAADGLHRLPSPPLVRAAGLGVLLLLVALPALIHDVRFDVLIPRTDTRALAYDWMESHMPEGGLAAVPYLAGGIHDQASVAAGTHSHGATTLYIASFLDGRLTTRYRVHDLTPEELASSSTVGMLSALGVRYILIAYENPALGCSRASPLERALAASGPPAVSFSPASGCPPAVFDVIDGYYVPVSGYEGFNRPGPFIRIYALASPS